MKVPDSVKVNSCCGKSGFCEDLFPKLGILVVHEDQSHASADSYDNCKYDDDSQINPGYHDATRNV
jgi:hypothetical protein